MPATESHPALNVIQPEVHHYHRDRRRMHLACFLIFCALPFFNIIRFDIPRQRFYFAGFELWINEFAIVFFALMFLMFVIAAVSMMYGRLYCAYACPQMIFSESASWLEDRIKRFITKHFIQWPVSVRNTVSRAIFYSILLMASVFVAFVFICYFVDPRDLLGRLFSLDIRTAGGIGGAATTLLAFVDFAFLRQRFCMSACPYGYIQGMLADKHTLLVRYDDPQKVCIECKKCVRVCHMGIDIRKSPFQIECVHCGECIDACDEILARLKKPGLIHYAWGEQGEALGAGNRPWWYRLGLRDGKHQRGRAKSHHARRDRARVFPGRDCRDDAGGAGESLGLDDHGRLSPGALADVVAYRDGSDLEAMLREPARVFKRGTEIVRDGKLLASVAGATQVVRPGHDRQIERRIRRFFDDHMSIGFDHFPLRLEEIAQAGGRVEEQPCRTGASRP